jgi:hypothetical protein
MTYKAGDIVVVYKYNHPTKRIGVPYDTHMVMAISEYECIDMTMSGITITAMDSFHAHSTVILRCKYTGHQDEFKGGQNEPETTLPGYVATFSETYIATNDVTYPSFCKLVRSAVSQCHVKHSTDIVAPNIEEAMCSSLVVGLWQAALFTLYNNPEDVWNLMPLSYKNCIPDNVVDILKTNANWDYIRNS